MSKKDPKAAYLRSVERKSLSMQKKLPKMQIPRWVGLDLQIEDTKPTSYIVDTYPGGRRLVISSDTGEGLVDYYGEYNKGYSYIHPTLEEWAKKHGCYWEWIHCGAIGLYW